MLISPLGQPSIAPVQGHGSGAVPPHFDLRPAGGGEDSAPLPPDFLDGSKTAADIDKKLSVTFSSINLASTINISEKKRRELFLENDVLVTSCSAIWGEKAANV